MEGPPHGRKRHPAEAQDRGALARLVRTLRLVADLLRARFVRWRREGRWDRLLARAQTKSVAVGEVEWEVSVDSFVARAHQHAAGARHADDWQQGTNGYGIVPPPNDQ